MQSAVDMCNEQVDSYAKKLIARQKADKVQVVISGGIVWHRLCSSIANLFVL